MANSKISALTSASTPLAGTETLPIVQSSTTKQVSVANLTAGRSVSALDLSTTAGPVEVRAPSGVGVRFIETSSGNTNRIQLGTGAGFGYVDATAGVGTTYLSLQVASSEKYKLDTNGNLIPVGAAKGINFTANTPAAGMTSQLLNWYEEGTWTPTQGAGLVVVGAFSSSGRYTRIGRQVTVSATLLGATSIACIAGGVFTAGLPFTPNAPGAGAASSSNLAGTVLYINSTIYSASAMSAASALYMTATYSV